MNYKSDITKSKFLSYAESDGTAFRYKSQNLIKLMIILLIFSKRKFNLIQPLTMRAQSNF